MRSYAGISSRLSSFGALTKSATEAQRIVLAIATATTHSASTLLLAVATSGTPPAQSAPMLLYFVFTNRSATAKRTQRLSFVVDARFRLSIALLLHHFDNWI